MSPELQRIAIAEACGFKHIQGPYDDGGFIGRKDRERHEIPDYLNDLNAMHEAKKTLDKRQRDVFAGFLGKITGGSCIDFGATRVDVTTEILFADAEQQAQAFLHTLGLWQEDPTLNPQNPDL